MTAPPYPGGPDCGCLHHAALRKAEAERDAAREAIRHMHSRLEAFEEWGRGRIFPHAYALDHKAGEHPNGCEGCAALASATDSGAGK